MLPKCVSSLPHRAYSLLQLYTYWQVHFRWWCRCHVIICLFLCSIVRGSSKNLMPHSLFGGCIINDAGKNSFWNIFASSRVTKFVIFKASSKRVSWDDTVGRTSIVWTQDVNIYHQHYRECMHSFFAFERSHSLHKCVHVWMDMSRICFVLVGHPLPQLVKCSRSYALNLESIAYQLTWSETACVQPTANNAVFELSQLNKPYVMWQAMPIW